MEGMTRTKTIINTLIVCSSTIIIDIYIRVTVEKTNVHVFSSSCKLRSIEKSRNRMSRHMINVTVRVVWCSSTKARNDSICTRTITVYLCASRGNDRFFPLRHSKVTVSFARTKQFQKNCSTRALQTIKHVIRFRRGLSTSDLPIGETFLILFFIVSSLLDRGHFKTSYRSKNIEKNSFVRTA